MRVEFSGGADCGLYAGRIPDLTGLNELSCKVRINHSRPIITKIPGALITKERLEIPATCRQYINHP